MGGLIDRLRAEMRRSNDIRIEMENMRKDGTPFWCTAHLTTFRHPIYGDVWVTVEEDITQRKRDSEELHKKEEELHQSRKIEAIGRLAGGVAHDFNNLITGIMGVAEEILESTGEHDPHRTGLEEIIQATNQAILLIRQLLAFGRRQVAATQVMDLNKSIRDLELMLRRLIGEDIELCLEVDASAGRFKADPSQVQQILMNVCVNARDAMPHGGQIVIHTFNRTFEEGKISRDNDVRPGRYVALQIRDTGHGMDPLTLSRIFEPFFTTKEMGRGTGLGLATVHGIVKQHGGMIEVISELNRGTTFTIYLPETAEPMTSPPSPLPLPPPSLPLEHPKTILLVEDNEMVRKVAARALRKRGYVVLEANGGDKATRVAAEKKRGAGLMVTAVVMPGVNGRQCFEHLAAQDPPMK